MIVKGKEVRNIDVEVNPLEVVETLLEKARKLLKMTSQKGLNYDYSSFTIDEGKIIELYVKQGLYYGHYDIDDEVVYKMDRSGDYDKDFLDYMVSLDRVSKYLRSNGYE